MVKRMEAVPGESLVGTIRRARMAMRLLYEPVEFVWNDGQVLATKVDETFLDCVHRMQAEIRAAAAGPKRYRSKETFEVFFWNDKTVPSPLTEVPEWIPKNFRESRANDGSRYVFMRDRLHVRCLLESEFLADYEPVDG